MALHSAESPAFGRADLSNCEREQIHLAGSIQPHGALLLATEPDLVVVQASANAAEFLSLEGDLLDVPLERLEGDLAARIRPHLEEPLYEIPTAVQCNVGDQGARFDVLLHRPADGGLIVELEKAGPKVELSSHLESALQRIVETSSLRALCDETARIFKDLTGYDRVMVYRFDEEGHGEVFSERREEKLEAFLGNRYPASDIPQMARRLYVRNRVRVLVDVEYQPVPLTPSQSPLTGQDLDMSLCFLRSMSPIHVQYLKNMGVGATLVASLVVGGKLWGLVSCHHYEPRLVHYETRAVCELLAETVATRLAALESFVQSQAEITVRRLEQRMIEAISRDGDWKTALFDGSRTLLKALQADGAALLFEGEVLSAGEVPGTQELRQIGKWLDSSARSPLIVTASLGQDQPDFAALKSVASGLLAVPLSNAPGEYLVWFRAERIRTVTWGGNPFKPVIIGDNPSDLSPRRSFAQWHQLVEGTSEPWTPADLNAARQIADSLADVVFQFRAVRMVIAENQLESIRQQVSRSDQPVLITDPNGQILLANKALTDLLPSTRPVLQSVEDLPAMFAEPDIVRHGIRELFASNQAWRAEIKVRSSLSEPKPLQVRGDPVLSSPGNVLGFVFLFTDLTENKAAETARRRFQESIIERHRVMSVQLDSNADLLYRNLLSSVVGNAQLAALEITDGMDLAHMPEKLESVQSSVTRSAELLEHLLWHATRESENDS